MMQVQMAGGRAMPTITGSTMAGSRGHALRHTATLHTGPGGVWGVLFIIARPELAIPLIVSSKPAAMTLPIIPAGLVSDYFVFYRLTQVATYKQSML
jgi:hypothetical protein